MANLEIQSVAAELRRKCLEPIKQVLVGKDEIVEVLGVALVAGENVFLLGPPGTAKSALVREFALRLGGQSFDYLLTRFTEPSELFGPFDLRRLRDGDLVTNTEGMLPEADFVFLDELMNANSAVLNSLLLALNERVFRRGRETRPLPMLLAIGASNRLPDDNALMALYDRFLLRVLCENVNDKDLASVLDAGWRREQRVEIQDGLDIEAVRSLQSAVAKVHLGGIQESYLALIRRLRDSGMAISDRRAVRLQRAIAASAIVCGRDCAVVSDLWVLRYIWESPAQVETVAAHVDSIMHQFAAFEEEEIGRHPLSDRDSGPDPERLNTALDALAEECQRNEKPAGILADSLSLLAARVEWVKTAEAREHLQSVVARVRETIERNPDQGSVA